MLSHTPARQLKRASDDFVGFLGIVDVSETPFELELDLFLVALTLVLDRELGVFRPQT